VLNGETEILWHQTPLSNKTGSMRQLAYPTQQLYQCRMF